MNRSIRLAGPVLTAAWLLLGCNQPDASVAQTAKEEPAVATTAGVSDAPAHTVTKEAPDEPAGLRSLQVQDLKGLAWRSVGPANMGL